MKHVITLKDLLEFPFFKDMKIVAGTSGLERTVHSCAQLEYQFVPEMKSRYYYDFFGPNMLVFTSFMYAVNAEHLILEAIRRLDALGVPGLIINNVFHIRIADSVLRFADASSFPLIIANESSFIYEKAIATITRAIEIKTNISTQERLIDDILNKNLNDKSIIEKTYEIYPSIGSHYRVDYYLPTGEVNLTTWDEVEKTVKTAPKPYKEFAYYKGGILIFHTLDNSCWDDIATNKDTTIKRIQKLLPHCNIGISWIHHRLDGMKYAIEEALQATAVHKSEGIMRYADLGIYRILFKAAEDYRMKEFSNDILQPIFDYDAEKNSSLAQTLFGLVENGRNIHKLATKLNQHENTIRQRLNRIEALTRLDYKDIEQYEQLSLAVKIHNCLGGWTKLPLN